MDTLEQKIKELEAAKKSVLFCLNHADGLEYWAQVVERLRREIKEQL